MNIIPVIEEVMRRRFPQTIESGTVLSISGNVAKVYISGSKQPVPAFYSENAPPEQGDDCVLIKANRAAPWVIITSYSQRNRGHSVNKQIAPAELVGATRTTNAKSVSGGGTTTSTSLYEEKLRIVIRTRGGSLLVAFSGTGTGSSSTARRLQVRIMVDGSQAAEFIHQMPTTGSFQAGVTLFGIVSRLPLGNHIVTLESYATAASVTLSGVLHAAEL